MFERFRSISNIQLTEEGAIIIMALSRLSLYESSREPDSILAEIVALAKVAYKGRFLGGDTKVNSEIYLWILDTLIDGAQFKYIIGNMLESKIQINMTTIDKFLSKLMSAKIIGYNSEQCKYYITRMGKKFRDDLGQCVQNIAKYNLD